ncbi:Pyridoxal 5'-phosphate synthase subunit snz1 [Ceratobasidium sp. 395]|nr:Pyridoxal 5'-phosphate synthase subunit snz1 [Ceratobasidium sp. 395]
MRQLWWLLSLVATVLAQDQTLSLGITATATPSASLPITPPPQRSLAACSADPLWRRLRNAEGVDPCALAMDLQRTCTTIDPIPALTGGESYTGPMSVAAATPCICTTVMYNLVAGCAACQHQRSNSVTRNWVPWSTWSALCPNRGQIVDGAWGRVTQFNSTIPGWAFTKVFQSDWFDLQQAVNVGITSTSAAPAATSSAPPPPPSNNNAKVGAIVGGVLGGVGFILLLLTCIFCFLRRRQRKWEQSGGVNRPQESPYIQSKNPANLKPGQYGVGGLPSPTRAKYDEKPRPLQTVTPLPDVLSDEHHQGKPNYDRFRPEDDGYGYQEPIQQGGYAALPNPGVAGVGAGGRGLTAPAPVGRVPPRDGAAGAAGQEGIFREDFSASEGHGYRSSNDAESRQFRNPSNGFGNGNGRGLHPPSSYPHTTPPVPAVIGRSDGGNVPAMGLGAARAERHDDDVHAYSTVGDASISLYPSDIDHHSEAPPPFVGGFTAPPEKEEYRLPERGYSSGYVIPGSGGSGGSRDTENRDGDGSPGLGADPFGANRRPAAFNRVFGDRSPTTGNGNGNGNGNGDGNGAGNGNGRGVAPANTTIGRGNSVFARRGGGSPLFMRNPPAAPNARRGTGPGGTSQDMGFGRQHQAAVGAYPPRDSSAFSEESSPTAVGFGGDVGGSARGEGSPMPTGPFAGRLCALSDDPTIDSSEISTMSAPAPSLPAANGNGMASPAGAITPASVPSAAAPPRSTTAKDGSSTVGTFAVKAGLAQMLKGGVIMDVINAEQARIAEEAGACAVMALERVPADIRKEGGVARMSDPKMIKEIVEAVTIPVMAKVRIGHFVEAQILQSIGIDYIDESEVLTPADEQHHINKHSFKVPFVCEALRRISEGAAMIRTKGEAGTGNVVEAVRHARAVNAEIRKVAAMTDEELYVMAKEIQAPFHLLKETARLKRLPVVSFAAGGVATPADAALMMQLGCDGVFVGSGIFHSGDPAKRAKAIVQAVTHYNNPKVLADVSEDIGEAMVGLTIDKDLKGGRMAGRGW